MKRIILILTPLLMIACSGAAAREPLPYKAFVPGATSGPIFIGPGECYDGFTFPVCTPPEWAEGALLTGSDNCWVLAAIATKAGFGLCQP